MTQIASQIATYLDESRDRFERDLSDWLTIPSVSTDSACTDDVRQAASWLIGRFNNLGFETEWIETNGHPIVYAESPKVAGAPTVLVYGHYDVQPPDPLDEWITPPFEPAVRDGNIFARGATDDKGQLITHLFSSEAWIRTEGKIPVQLKFLIEGEEECGSQALTEYLNGDYDGNGQSVSERLDSDICVISDGSQFEPGKPAITYGLKGISYFELRLRGPKQDLHSGAFGGSVTNPANALSQILATMINADGEIQLDGFYDDVVPLTQRERDEFASLGFDDKQCMRHLEVDGFSGESGYTTLERRWARPTFDINGIWGGYQGEGAKTVLPAKAAAKFSFRLVPDQDPQKVKLALEKHIRDQCPPGIQFELEEVHGAPGVMIPLDNPFVDAAARAIEHGFGTAPVFIRTGGSIPVVNLFRDKLGIDTLFLGWGQDDDNAHSPNEKFLLADFHRGIRSSAQLWEELAATGAN